MQAKLALDCAIRALQHRNRMEFFYRKAGEEETESPAQAKFQRVSPYYLAFHVQDYYLIGATDKHDALTAYRVDRIRQARETQDKIRPREEIPELRGSFDLSRFLRRALSLYGGETVRLRLRCKKQVMGAVTRQFGGDIPVRAAEGDTVCTQFCCEESVALYRWLMGHCDQIMVEEPPHVKEKLKQYLEEAASAY